MQHRYWISLFFAASGLFAGEKEPPQLSANVIATNNAFAPVPVFSLEKPALLVFVSAQKNGWRYEPDFSLSSEGRPWMYNNWLRYKAFNGSPFTLTPGLNPSLFFTEEVAVTGASIAAKRNLTGELEGGWHPAANLALLVAYRLNRAFEFAPEWGHFFIATFGLSALPLPADFLFSLRAQFIYFNHTGDLDGYFTSAYFSLGNQVIPVSLFVQVSQPLWVNFPGAELRWNFGSVLVL